MELNKDTAERHAKTLVEAEQARFYGYHWSDEDQMRLEDALGYFETTANILRQQLN